MIKLFKKINVLKINLWNDWMLIHENAYSHDAYSILLSEMHVLLNLKNWFCDIEKKNGFGNAYWAEKQFSINTLNLKLWKSPGFSENSLFPLQNETEWQWSSFVVEIVTFYCFRFRVKTRAIPSIFEFTISLTNYSFTIFGMEWVMCHMCVESYCQPMKGWTQGLENGTQIFSACDSTKAVCFWCQLGWAGQCRWPAIRSCRMSLDVAIYVISVKPTWFFA